MVHVSVGHFLNVHVTASKLPAHSLTPTKKQPGLRTRAANNQTRGSATLIMLVYLKHSCVKAGHAEHH